MRFLLEVTCYLCLLYTCACANFALFKLGQFSFYLLVPRHTPPFSLLSNALLACRFSVSISYNFMDAMALPENSGIRHPDVQNSEFYNVLGRRMDTSLFGSTFTTYVPIALVPYVAIIALGAFNRVARCFLRSERFSFSDDWEEKSEYASRGLALLR